MPARMTDAEFEHYRETWLLHNEECDCARCIAVREMTEEAEQ